MHPVIARFLTSTPPGRRSKEKAGEPLAPRSSSSRRRRATPAARAGRQRPRAAADARPRWCCWPRTPPPAPSPRTALAAASQKAREALKEEGASDEESDAFIASILLEEAFGYEQDVDAFDADYVKESLGEVPALAALSKETVDALFLAFIQGAPSEPDRKAREHMARALFEIAWSEGPTSINPEHLETLLDNEVVQESRRGAGRARARHRVAPADPGPPGAGGPAAPHPAAPPPRAAGGDDDA